MNRVLSVILGLLLALSVACGKQEEKADEKKEAAKADILIGVLSDLSGATSSVGRPYADGIKQCADYLNAKGGINGRQLKLIQVDYAYNVQQALSAYKQFKSEGVVALQGWGTGDTEALVETVGKDQIPFFSASYSAHLTDPKKAPYNFFIAADYSTQLRAGLDFFKSEWKEKRAPRMAFVYPNHPYGLAPIAAGKEYAQAIGFDVVGEENVDLKAMDATTQLLALQKKNPDFVWVGGTTPSTAVVLKDAKKLKMKATFLTNIWGADEQLFQLAGDATEGHYSLQTAVVYGQDVPGMAAIKEVTKNEPQLTHYIRGFASMLTMAEAIRIAGEKGEVTGPSIKAAAETLRDFDTMGLTPPVSFFPEDHRPNLAVNIFQMKGGKLNFVKTQTLERKAEWLGK